MTTAAGATMTRELIRDLADLAAAEARDAAARGDDEEAARLVAMSDEIAGRALPRTEAA